MGFFSGSFHLGRFGRGSRLRGPRQRLRNRAAAVKVFDAPANLAEVTLAGGSFTDEVTPPGSGTMTYAMTVKGTDDAGTLLSIVGAVTFAGRYAPGTATGISSTADYAIEVDGTPFVNGDTRLALANALMDGSPHLVLVTGIPLNWTNIRAGGYDQLADQEVEGVLVRHGVLGTAAADYSDALADVAALHEEVVAALAL